MNDVPTSVQIQSIDCINDDENQSMNVGMIGWGGVVSNLCQEDATRDF